MAEQTVKLNLDTRQFDRGISRATAAIGAIVSVAAIRSVSQLADEFQQVNARLKLATGGGEAFNRAQQRIQQVASSTRSGLSETADLFSRLARSTADTTVSQEQLLSATTAINQAIKVSGASSIEANAAITQLGQGLASGALRGDELRSVLEQTPRLAQAIAAGLGVSIGQLRELGTEGKLTTEVVLNALNNQAPKIAAEFAQIPPTIADAFTALNNAVLKSTETLNNAGFGAVLSGIAKGAEDSLGALSAAFKQLLPVQDLNALAQRIQVAFTDTLIFILQGVQNISGPLSEIFNVVKKGINGLIAFGNQLPPEVQIFGLIGFFLVGRGIKLLVLAVAAFFDEIKGFMDKAVKYFENKINAMIDIYNDVVTFFGQEPMDKVIFGDGAFSNMVDEVNKKFVDFVGQASGGLKKIGEDSNKAGKAIGVMIEKLVKARNVAAQPLPQPKLTDPNKVDTGSAVSIGGPSQKDLDKQKEQLEKQFLQLSQSLYTETQALQVEYEKKLTLLEDYYMQTEMADRDYYRIKEQLEKKHQKALDAISKARVQEQLNIFKSGQYQQLNFAEMAEKEKVKFAMEAGTSVLNELGKQNKAAFQAAKALNIAMAIMNTAAGATKALSQGGVFGPLLAGLVIAAGAVQIAAIQSQQYQGRKTGGLVQKGQPYVVGEGGSEMFIPNRTGTIIPNGNMPGSGQNINVHFTINAVDSAGVDELLVSRRSTITNIIRDAATQKGNRSPV